MGFHTSGVECGHSSQEGSRSLLLVLEVAPGLGPDPRQAALDHTLSGLAVHLSHPFALEAAHTGEDQLRHAVPFMHELGPSSIIYLKAKGAGGAVHQAADLLLVQVRQFDQMESLPREPGSVLFGQLVCTGCCHDVGSPAFLQSSEDVLQLFQALAVDMAGQVVQEKKRRQLGGQRLVQGEAQGVAREQAERRPRLKDPPPAHEFRGHGPADQFSGLAGFALLCPADDDQAVLGTQISQVERAPVDPVYLPPTPQVAANLLRRSRGQRLHLRQALALSAPRPPKEIRQHDGGGQHDQVEPHLQGLQVNAGFL